MWNTVTKHAYEMSLDGKVTLLFHILASTSVDLFLSLVLIVAMFELKENLNYLQYCKNLP